MANENKPKTIYSVSDVVEHYDEAGLTGCIKIYFKKSDVKTRTSNLDKPYYVVRPLIVKVGNIFDDHVTYSIFLKPKYHYRLSLINADMWLMIIDDEQKSFINDDGNDVNYYDVSFKYITNSKLIDTICKKALATHNIEEFDDDEI